MASSPPGKEPFYFGEDDQDAEAQGNGEHGHGHGPGQPGHAGPAPDAALLGPSVTDRGGSGVLAGWFSRVGSRSHDVATLAAGSGQAGSHSPYVALPGRAGAGEIQGVPAELRPDVSPVAAPGSDAARATASASGAALVDPLGAQGYNGEEEGDAGAEDGAPGTSQGGNWPRSYRQSMDWYSYMPSPLLFSPLVPSQAQPHAPPLGEGLAGEARDNRRRPGASNPIPTRGGVAALPGPGTWADPGLRERDWEREGVSVRGAVLGRPAMTGPMSYPAKPQGEPGGRTRVRRRGRRGTGGPETEEQAAWQQAMAQRQQRFLLPSPSYIMPFGSPGQLPARGALRAPLLQHEAVQARLAERGALHQHHEPTSLLPSAEGEGFQGDKIMKADPYLEPPSSALALTRGRGKQDAGEEEREEEEGEEEDEGAWAELYDGDAAYYDKAPRQGCSFTQAVLNGVNILAGVGVLTTPYALMQSG